MLSKTELRTKDKVWPALGYYTNQRFQRSFAAWQLQMRMLAWSTRVQSLKNLKRVMDLVMVGLAIPCVLPLMILTAIAIRLDSPGPIFFKQARVGKRGKPFTCYKFRSMYIDAEARKSELLDQNEVDGPVFKMQNDPRMTRVGRIIRKLSIDELPQLINILKGDMSFVGPRPPVPNEVKEYTFEQRRRLDAVPGLTGLQQISGRSDLTFERWVELDLQYIDQQSIRMDIWIILKTIPAVISGKGAY